MSAELIWSSNLDGDAVASFGADGVIAGDPVPVEDLNGNAKGALQFDGVDDWISIVPTQTVFTAGSISIWVKATNFTNTEAGVVGMGESGSGTAEYFTIHKGWRTDLDDGDDGVGAARLDAASDAGAPTGTWQHLVTTFTAQGELRLYVNGVLQADVQSLATAEDSYTFSNDWIVGAEQKVANRTFAGAVDDVRFYNHQLEQADVDALYADGPAFDFSRDLDGDGISNADETSGALNPWASGSPTGPPGDATDPENADSDFDTIPDGEEIVAGADGFITDPNNEDTDGDGLFDDEELAADYLAAGYDPTVDNAGADFDDDGLTTSEELFEGTDPLLADTDGDGLTDGEEVNGVAGTDPLLADTDGDLVTDSEELTAGTSPTDESDFPQVPNLQVDFSLVSNEPSSVHEPLYQPYFARHEVNSQDSDPELGSLDGVDRLGETYSATFYGNEVEIALSVSFPDLVDPLVATAKQLIDRSANLGNYAGSKPDLMRDYLGADTRIENGGNGGFAPTTLRLALEGIPAGDYLLRTYHHDILDEATPFRIAVTDADSTGETLPAIFRMTSGQGTNRVNPPAESDPAELRSTVVQLIRSNGTDPVVLDFQPYQESGFRFVFGINGFELEETVDSDNDGVPDSEEVRFFGDITVSDFSPGADQDADGVSDLTEVLLRLDPNSNDTDGDGLTDDLEPLVAETEAGAGLEVTSFSHDAEAGSISLDWNPAVGANVVGSLDLQGFPETLGTDVTPPFEQVLAGNLAGASKAFFRVQRGLTVPGPSPFVADTDGDGLTDGEEVNTYGSNPTVTDSDGDGFSDGHEAQGGSSLVDADSGPDPDGDGFSNSVEVAAGSDPDDAASFPQADAAMALWIDFNSNQAGGGDASPGDLFPETAPATHNQPGFSSYMANHETDSTLVTGQYTAFGPENLVEITPFWPDTTDVRVKQMIGRSDDQANTWRGDTRLLLRDFLGIDTRVENGGNGVYDGTTGTPTRMELVIEGLPAGTYQWQSFHHDVENAWTDFQVEISADGGTTFGSLSEVVTMTDGLSGGTPAAPQTYDGPGNPGSIDPADLPSTYTTTFVASGSDEVVIRFVPLSTDQVHRAIFGINGFKLTKQP
ncbi:LamG domain-containing protein [Roseibacillus ishigakijimensis]|uniref:LamG domain-containing protein n=1 Tax=Roseibacillus ishigakijimensis TaxID=454146 RepID=UPI001904E327|nr:LamG domain-containing protein [Roseibacillus ishigakijimensis]